MADIFRHFYDDHLSENRNVLDAYITPVSDEQFTHRRGNNRNTLGVTRQSVRPGG